MRKKSLLLMFLLLFSLLFNLSALDVLAMSSSPVEPEANEAGLIANYRLDGNLEDETGNFASGEVIGGLIGESGGSISYQEGMRGQAIYLDGQSGVRLADGLVSSNSYSVALWINPEEITGFTTTFFGAETTEQWVSVVPDGPSGQTVVWSGTDWYDADTDMQIPTDQWSHLLFTVDNGEIKVYINGEEMFSDSGFPDVFTTDNAEFALGVNWWDLPFKGMIDDLRIYNKAIEPDKVAELAEDAPEIDLGDGPRFRNVSVHDPMITEDNGTYYIFGSHMASAKSEDLIDWEQISNGLEEGNPLVPDPFNELSEALEWPEPESAESTWAKSVIKFDDKYHMYFSTSNWGYTRSAIALATADDIEGPYEYQEMIIKSHNQGETNIIGERHNPTIHPNAIDPHVFRDAEDNLWMLYGSYAGGVFVLELDEETGLVKEGQGYGEKITGGNHAAMEGPYIQYHPESEYYYFMISFGTLATDGGYNIRIARSKDPAGPYYDSMGQDMIEASSRHWNQIEPYGVKAMGNFEFVESELSYLSPGHNSAYYDENTGKGYVVFHTRFPDRGEAHQVRVHQMLMNEADWPVIMPHRYRGETVSSYSSEEVAGVYQYIDHGRSITADVSKSSNIELTADGSISGAVDGSWELTGDYTVNLTIEGETYQGAFLEQWDDGLQEHVMTFSALSEKGVTVWGSQLP